MLVIKIEKICVQRKGYSKKYKMYMKLFWNGDTFIFIFYFRMVIHLNLKEQ